MKKFLFCIACLLMTLSLAAQTPDVLGENVANQVISGGQILTLTAAPSFKKGGFDKYCVWVHNRVRYPAEIQGALKQIEGTVMVKIIVGTDGVVTVAEVIESPHQAMTDEVVRVINGSPKWTPGMIADPETGQDVPVAVAYKIPVEFKIQKEKAYNEMKGQMQRMDTNIRTYGSSN